MMRLPAALIIRIFGTLAVLVAGQLFCSAATIEEIELKNSVEVDHLVPRTQYGRPLAGGSLRVLFLM